MAERISIGDAAPDFDLSSTEEALLTLRDEIPRATVLVYFFLDMSSERVKRDLATLASRSSELAESHAKVLAVSTAKMPVLKQLQVELNLPFPLLRDDRSFSSEYGIEEADEGEEASPALFLIDSQQVIAWLANPVTSVDDAMPQVLKSLQGQGSPTGNYPKSVINRVVDRWVN